MFVDSHCHINFPEFSERLPELFGLMIKNQVSHALCVGVNFEDLDGILDLATAHQNVFASVGVHPDYEGVAEPSEEDLLSRATHPKVVAIGETGLDYFRLKGDLEWQRQRFRTHIRAARRCRKPLIIHTRAAAEDTIRIMQEEGAEVPSGVMHCFTETLEVAQAALALGFMISFSGIVTFKNARELKAVAAAVPLESMLIETDAPYLAPVPHRGKMNEPGFVCHVAEEIARIKGISVERVADATSANFFRLFHNVTR
jgi:TatD DNase family protein